MPSPRGSAKYIANRRKANGKYKKSAKGRNANLDVVLKEMAKCIVLCANCHAIHHYELNCVRTQYNNFRGRLPSLRRE